MFKQLIDAFRKRDTLGEMLDQFGEMLELGRTIFNQASDVVEKKLDSGSVHDELRARDKKINANEQSIREKIVIHLSMGNEQDVGICLVLMSVVKDAERIGDYCKNLFQIGEFFQNEYKRGEFTGPLDDIRKRIDELFPLVRKAFLEANKKLARRSVEDTRVVRKQCDMLIKQLLTPGGSALPDESTAYALRARFYKRVVAHLGNIATSVVNPVPLMDYRGKKPLDEPDNT